MGKAKKKSKPQNNWLAEIKKNEVLFGHVAQPLHAIYPHLRHAIWKSNNLTTFENQRTTDQLKTRLDKCRVHPYEDEIRAFNLSTGYLEDAKSSIPKPTPPDGSLTAVWINEKIQLQKLITHLKTLKHIFLDLENHSWRSYRGITALLQLSDGSTVYLVDTLKLFGEMKAFEEIFLDPGIVKVFHASQNDIKWLEKDFSLYLVGLMDTQMMHRAIRYSNNIGYKDIVHEFFPEAGLDKAIRNTDFRVRPLHQQQEKYAILDVYYLPYIYFQLLTEMDYSKLARVVRDCQELCMQRYKFPNVTSIKPTDSKIMKCLKIARDIAAKKEDVNPEFLASVGSLEKLITKKDCSLGITTCPAIHYRFLAYREAISIALKGEDPCHVFETVYRDLGIPFPYTGMFCLNCEATTHVKRNCPEPKSVGKEKKRLLYLANPEKKLKETRRRNAKVKQNPIAKRKRNVRNNLRQRRRAVNQLFH